MSEENLEVAKRGYRAFRAGNFEALLDKVTRLEFFLQKQPALQAAGLSK